jgi:hypothetical protein
VKDSGVVAGVEILVSADACPLCQTIARRHRFSRLNEPIAVIGDHPTYGVIEHPPFHPHCNCTLTYVLKPEYSGEPEPDWTNGPLEQPEPEPVDYGLAGEPVPEPDLVIEPEPRSYRDFNALPTKEIAAWQRERFGAWQESLDPDERRSISGYGGNTYDAINRTLRSGTLDHWMNDWAREDVPLIDRAISRGRTPEDLVVYRRVESLPFEVEVGGRITDPAFMSTSLEGEWLKRRAVGFVRGELPQVYRIEVPKGTPVASMSDYGIEDEVELLFGRDTTIEITGMTLDFDPEGNPIMLVDARMVPDGG